MTKIFKLITPIAAAACLVLFPACASTQHAAPVFQAPSVAPVQQAVTRVEQHVKGAQGAAKKLADECAQKSAGWQAAYEQLMQELTDDYVAAATSKSLADELQKQVSSTVDSANKEIDGIARERDTYKSKNDALLPKYHRSKFIGGIEAGLIFLVIGGFIGFRLLPPPYGFLALLAGPVATLFYNLLL